MNAPFVPDFIMALRLTPPAVDVALRGHDGEDGEAYLPEDGKQSDNEKRFLTPLNTIDWTPDLLIGSWNGGLG